MSCTLSLSFCSWSLEFGGKLHWHMAAHTWLLKSLVSKDYWHSLCQSLTICVYIRTILWNIIHGFNGIIQSLFINLKQLSNSQYLFHYSFYIYFSLFTWYLSLFYRRAIHVVPFNNRLHKLLKKIYISFYFTCGICLKYRWGKKRIRRWRVIYPSLDWLDLTSLFFVGHKLPSCIWPYI